MQRLICAFLLCGGRNRAFDSGAPAVLKKLVKPSFYGNPFCLPQLMYIFGTQLPRIPIIDLSVKIIVKMLLAKNSRRTLENVDQPHRHFNSLFLRRPQPSVIRLALRVNHYTVHIKNNPFNHDLLHSGIFN